MILAAGRGERMRPLTDHTPKPLLQVGGKPLIVWHIERLVAAGLNQIIINHAHLGQQIEDTLGNGAQFNAQIQYSAETQALETAGGIRQALAYLDEGNNTPFAVINGDVFCDYDFAKLTQRARELGAHNMHLILVNNPEHHPNGDFGLHNTKLTQSEPKYTFSGIGLYRPNLFQHIEKGTTAPLAPLIRRQITEQQVRGELHTGLWIDVGTPERLKELNEVLTEK